jgi:16S rRNA (adenine1518-N6/adenine1519-N6)-dimethyltransferase
MFQTKTQIEALLQAANLKPQKRYGQHFLIDRNLMNRLVDSASIGPEDVVLEVGPGTASLTSLLAAKAGAVVAVEADRQLLALADQQLHARGVRNVDLIHADVLASKHRIQPEVLAALTRQQAALAGRIVLVANLPFDVATPLLINLVLDHPTIDPLLFTVQKEVGARILARPGRHAYGTLSVLVQALTDPVRLADVPRQTFWPQPNVDAVMLQLTHSPAKRAVAGDVPHLAATVRNLFGHRRKTLRHNLRIDYPQVVAEPLAEAASIDLGRRPETLAVAEWVRLAEQLPPAIGPRSGRD